MHGKTNEPKIFALDPAGTLKLLLRPACRELGASVEVFTDVDALERRLSFDMPDLVLLGGIEISARELNLLRSLLSESGRAAPRVLFCSALAFDFRVWQQLKLVGVDRMTPRPANPSELAREIAGLLGLPESSPTHFDAVAGVR